jgi:hypothetical protein
MNCAPRHQKRIAVFRKAVGTDAGSGRFRKAVIAAAARLQIRQARGSLERDEIGLNVIAL